MSFARFFALLLVLSAAAFPAFGQEEEDEERERAAAEEVEGLNEEIREAEQQADFLNKRLKLVRRRVSLLKQARDAQRTMFRMEREMEEADEDGNEARVEKIEREFTELEIQREFVGAQLELIEHRESLLEISRDVAESRSKPLLKETRELNALLDRATELVDVLFKNIRAGREEAIGETEEKLEEMERDFQYRRRSVQLRSELFFAEREGEDEYIEELEEELEELRREFGIDKKQREREDERMREEPDRKTKTATGPPPVELTDNEIDEFARLNFASVVLPQLKKACFDCHAGESVSGDLDLESLVKVRPFVRHRTDWKNVMQQLRIRSMPPADADQPTEADRKMMLGWLRNAVDRFDYATVRSPGHEPPRRLTHDEFNNTVRDLTGLDLRPADRFPADMSASSGFKNSANSLFIQPITLERYVNAADAIVNDAWPLDDANKQQAAAWNRLLNGAGTRAAENPTRGRADIPPTAADVRKILTRFLTQAYRRPVQTAEVDRFFCHFQERRQQGATVKSALRDVLQIVFVSPNFLIRSEQQPNGQSGEVSVSDWELASRLSYFLWASMPDDELFAQARGKTLHEPTELRRQVDRMLGNERAGTLGEIFAAQWLGVSNIDRVQRDQIDNPWATDSLVAAMKNETALLFNSLIRNDETLPRLVNADYTFLNEELARHYRIDGVRGENMQRVSLAETNRRGILGHGSILTTTSFPGRTSPVVRGNWILDSLLGTPPPPPPPNVSEFDERVAENRRLTSRQKLELHRENPNCYTCHSQIDPLGFALEEFEWFGRPRRNRRLDTTSQLPGGKPFTGLIGLSRALVEERMDDLSRQFTEKLLSYALGRQLEYTDEATVQELLRDFRDNDYRIRSLIHAIVQSDAFRIQAWPELN